MFDETKGQSSQNTSIRGDEKGGITRERILSGQESLKSNSNQGGLLDTADDLIITDTFNEPAEQVNKIDKETAIFIEVEQSKQKVMKLGKSIVAQQLSMEDSQKVLAYQEVAHSGGSSSPHDMEIDLRSGS